MALGLTLAGSGCPTHRAVHGPMTPGDGRTHIVFFDIGQADAMLVVNAGRAMLVDAGATWTQVARQNFRDIPRRLEAMLGHRHLDYFVVSHYHQDHIGLHGVGPRAGVGDLGLWGLLNDEGVTVDTLVDRGFYVEGKPGNTQKHYEVGVLRWIREGKVKRRLRVKRQDLLDLGPGLRIEVIASSANGQFARIKSRLPGFFDRFPPSENDYSIVMKLTRGPFELVSGGDLSGFDVTRSFGPNMRMSYNDIETGIAADIGDVEVYHVHHHGSKNSSNPCFISVLHPEVSVFTTGKNSYGHPDLRVYNALRRLGKVFITGGADAEVYNEVKRDIVEGDVTVTVAADGQTYWVNGLAFQAKSEKTERSRRDFVAGCPIKEPAEGLYMKIEGGPPEAD